MSEVGFNPLHPTDPILNEQFSQLQHLNQIFGGKPYMEDIYLTLSRKAANELIVSLERLELTMN